jgi:hypothetical protein
LGTDYKALTVISFDKDSTDNYTIDRQAVEERYIEIGDNIKVTNRESTMSGEWYSNKNEKSLISEEKTVTLDSVTFMTRLYHKRIKTTKGTTCIEPEYYEIPLNVHPVSKEEESETTSKFVLVSSSRTSRAMRTLSEEQANSATDGRLQPTVRMPTAGDRSTTHSTTL